MTEKASRSSKKPASPQPSPGEHVYKAIIALGVIGTQEAAAHFTATWMADCEERAHRIARDLPIPVQIVPLPEDTA